jgi:glutathione peroxidase-family protein
VACRATFRRPGAGAEPEISRLCRARFGVAFPLAAKTRVTGADAHPFYRWAARELGLRAASRKVSCPQNRRCYAGMTGEAERSGSSGSRP